MKANWTLSNNQKILKEFEEMFTHYVDLKSNNFKNDILKRREQRSTREPASKIDPFAYGQTRELDIFDGIFLGTENNFFCFLEVKNLYPEEGNFLKMLFTNDECCQLILNLKNPNMQNPSPAH